MAHTAADPNELVPHGEEYPEDWIGDNLVQCGHDGMYGLRDEMLTRNTRGYDEFFCDSTCEGLSDEAALDARAVTGEFDRTY